MYFSFLFDRSSLGESIPSITSSQDSLAPIGLYTRPTGMPNSADSPSSSSLQLQQHNQQHQQQPQSQRAEQQKKKGIKSSLGKFFSKKDKAGKSSKDGHLSSSSGTMSPLANRSDEINRRDVIPSLSMGLNVDPEWGVPVSATPTPTGTPALGQKDFDRRIKRKYVEIFHFHLSCCGLNEYIFIFFQARIVGGSNESRHAIRLVERSYGSGLAGALGGNAALVCGCLSSERQVWRYHVSSFRH